MRFQCNVRREMADNQPSFCVAVINRAPFIATMLAFAGLSCSGEAAMAAGDPCEMTLQAHGFVENSAKVCGFPPLDEAQAKQDGQAVCGARYNPQSVKIARATGYTAVMPMI